MIPLGKRTDPEVLVSQMVRNLGELPWLPSFAISDATMTLTGLDETSFEGRSRPGDKEIGVRFEIKDQGDLI